MVNEAGECTHISIHTYIHTYIQTYTQEKSIKEAESTVANMERQIPKEQQILEGLYEATKDETKALRSAALRYKPDVIRLYITHTHT